MKHKSIITILLALAIFFLTATSVVAEDIDDLFLPGIPGRTQGASTFFEIKDSEYLNIFLQSSKEITVLMESVPKLISLNIGASSVSSSTILTLNNLELNKTYYRYDNSYKNETILVSTSSGTYTFNQDLTQSHHVWFQETKGTIFIPEQCSVYGAWDSATSTCTLTQDLIQSVEITINNIILDCNNHTATGFNTGYGVYLNSKSGVAIKNCTATNFSYGLYAARTSNSVFINNVPRNNYGGAWFNEVSYSNVTNNIANLNKKEGLVFLDTHNNIITKNEVYKTISPYYGGIMLSYSHDNTLANNIVSETYRGITIWRSSSNIATNNITDSNYYQGIFIMYSSNNTVTENKILNNYQGVYIEASSGNRIYHNNFIENLYQASSYWYQWGDNPFNNDYPEGGNYWSDYVGVDEKSGSNQDKPGSDGIGDTPHIFTGGQDRYPFMKESGWEASVSQPPTFSNLNQYKSDGITTITEGQTTTESTIVFKAIVSDSDNDKVKLQVQIKEVDHEWRDIIESGLVNSGSEAVVTRYGLIEGQYRWHARAVDEKGTVSEGDWQEFGVAGNVDFEVKLVPLYTQVWSPHPSWSETDEWDGLQYADGKSICGFAIKDCGCAITSTIMILRFYDITVAKDNNDVNPLNLNNWLVANNGYDSGDLDWDKIDDYSREPQSNIKRLHYVGPINSENTDLLDIYLANLQPTILKVHPIVQGELSPHFIVADGKLTNTYTIRDPAWYNTRYLTQAPSSYVYNYNNNFSQLRLFSPTVVVRGIIHLHLASPAELLVTDPLGRKLGKDPIANIEYNEIPEGVYYPEGIGNPFAETPTPVEEAKNIWIPDPLDGNYDVKIIGTGIGGYVADFSIYDQTGESQDVSYEGTTTTDNVQEFDLSYSVETVEEVELYRIVDIDIKPGSDPNSINLKSKGVTPVAVLADEFFDAEGVVIDSILFVGVSPKKGNLEDVDNDGDIDLILHFETQDLQLTLGDVEAILTGQLTNGTLIKGVDFVRIVPSEKENKGGKKGFLLIGIISLCIIGIGFLIRKKKIRFSDKIVETIRKIKIKK